MIKSLELETGKKDLHRIHSKDFALDSILISCLSEV